MSYGDLYDRCLAPIPQIPSMQGGAWTLRVPFEVLRAGVIKAIHDVGTDHLGALESADPEILIGTRGDLLLYGPDDDSGPARKRLDEVTGALIRCIAALAHQPGGIGLSGLHWCVASGHIGGVWSDTPCPEEVDRELRGHPPHHGWWSKGWKPRHYLLSREAAS
jgi:hypothetical protein